MELNLFNKTHLLEKIKPYGFDDIDDVAFLKLKLCVEICVINIMNNLMIMQKELKSKVIDKKHFALILYHLDTLKNRAPKCKKEIVVGGTVLPSEYFGSDSGRYFDSSAGTDITGLSNVTRGELSAYSAVIEAQSDNNIGGSSSTSFITIEMVKQLVNIFKSKRKDDGDFKMTKAAYQVICKSANETMQELLTDCKKNIKIRKKLSKANLYNNLKSRKYINLTCLAS